MLMEQTGRVTINDSLYTPSKIRVGANHITAAKIANWDAAYAESWSAKDSLSATHFYLTSGKYKVLQEGLDSTYTLYDSFVRPVAGCPAASRH
jgi:hypothetical protein